MRNHASMLHNVVTTIQGTHKLEYREVIIKESKDGSNGSYINWPHPRP